MQRFIFFSSESHHTSKRLPEKLTQGPTENYQSMRPMACTPSSPSPHPHLNLKTLITSLPSLFSLPPRQKLLASCSPCRQRNINLRHIKTHFIMYKYNTQQTPKRYTKLIPLVKVLILVLYSWEEFKIPQKPLIYFLPTQQQQTLT